jgi:hypothetical protein
MEVELDCLQICLLRAIREYDSLVHNNALSCKRKEIDLAKLLNRGAFNLHLKDGKLVDKWPGSRNDICLRLVDG